VAALMVGEAHGPELWTLRGIFSVPCELHVVQALQRSTLPRLKRARRLVEEHGLFTTASRWVAKRLIGARQEEKEQQTLDELFDVRSLREW
jgi:hypothetical protein